MSISVQQGQTVSVTTGVWAGTAPITFAYQWQRNTVDIIGATSAAYVTQAADVGFALRCRVTATNVAGSTVAFSASTDAVTALPPVSGEATQISWTLPLSLSLLAGGAGGGSVNYQDGMFDFRADFDSLVTTANGAVSALASGQSLPGTWSQGVSANQPAHDSAGDYVRFSAASDTDSANGDFLTFSTQLADRYRTQGASLGVLYMLFRIHAAVSWTTWLFRVGVNNTNFTGRDRRAYHVGLFASTPRIIGIRGSATSNQNATINALPAVNEWCALAFVLNDSRASGTRTGASDQVSRIFAKTKAGGTFATMAVASSPVLDTTASWASSSPPDGTEANLLRLRHNNSISTIGFGNVDIHSVGFDAAPPITNGDIESVLDTLLGRV